MEHQEALTSRDVTRLDAVQNAALQDLASEPDHRQMALLVVIKLAARYPNMNIGARVRAVRHVYLISHTRDDFAITRLGAGNRGTIRLSREFYLCHRFLPSDTAPPRTCVTRVGTDLPESRNGSNPR
jgi:hypothetical protein